MSLLTLTDLETQYGDAENEQYLTGQTVLLRVDFNVPLTSENTVSDDTRIRAALPTLKWLQERGAVVVLLSHLGRPKGTKNPKLSLLPVAEHLQELLDQTIYFCDVMDEPRILTRDLRPGSVVLLENLRFHAGETSNESTFAEKLELVGDLYVNDAFGLVHREHASVHALAEIFAHKNKAFAGLLIEKEVEALTKILMSSRRSNTVAVLGGAKVKDKIVLIENIARRCKDILIGGAMSYTFLAAKGIEVGNSRVEQDKIKVAKELLELCAENNVDVHLPLDHVTAAEFSEEAEAVVTEGAVIPEGFMGLDIGPKTQELYASIIKEASRVFWNGPMGVFEWDAFAGGTRAVGESLKECEGYTLVGGGDSAAATHQLGFAEFISHISTGGGASLAFLEERTLPGLVFLSRYR